MIQGDQQIESLHNHASTIWTLETSKTSKNHAKTTHNTTKDVLLSLNWDEMVQVGYR